MELSIELSKELSIPRAWGKLHHHDEEVASLLLALYQIAQIYERLG